MVYHFEAQKFLHVCIPQSARGGGEHKAKEQRDRKEKRRREGVQREKKVEQQKRGREMEREKEKGRETQFLLFFVTLVSNAFCRSLVKLFKV